MVSVIIPTYNYAQFLPDALESLLQQSYTYWECIIVNNGSIDNTEEIVNLYLQKDGRFRYFLIENKGVSHARNFALKQSNGEFIQFLDADDLLEKEKLKTQVDYLKRNNVVDLIYGEARYFTTKNKSLRNFSMHQKDVDWMPRISGNGNKLIMALLKKNIFPINAPLFRKSLIEKSGAFDEKLQALEDWDLWIRFALDGAGFQWGDGPFTAALIREHSESASQNKKMMRWHILPILKRYLLHSGTNMYQKLYLLLRYEEEWADFLFNEKSKKVLLPETDSVFTTLFFMVLPISFFPFYVVIKIYRRLF